MPTPLTAPQLAQALGVKPRSVLRWARQGVIPCHRAGSRVWFDLDEVNAATFRGTKVRPVSPKVMQPAGGAPIGPRFFEIINGHSARRAGRTSTGRKRTGRSG